MEMSNDVVYMDRCLANAGWRWIVCLVWFARCVVTSVCIQWSFTGAWKQEPPEVYQKSMSSHLNPAWNDHFAMGAHDHRSSSVMQDSSHARMLVSDPVEHP